MTHFEFIQRNFNVIAKTANAIFFDAYGELCCEINGTAFDCKSVEEFFELVAAVGDDDFQE